ncbi:MAG: DNA polymerase III subunit delta [Chlorobi bacterium]|nr:DNA polymerase III subunit delta [Chlorobiota bacterium]
MLIESPTALLRAKPFPRLVFLFGEEEFLVDETVESIIGIARERGVDAVDIDVLDGDELGAEQLIRRAEAFPMAGPERLIVIRHFERVSLGKRNSADQMLLASYFRSPSPTTTMVLMASGDGSPDELKGLAAALKNPKQRAKADAKISKLRFPYSVLIEHATWLEFPRLYERQIPEWIVRRFKAYSCDCPIEVAEYLVVQVGTSLRDLANEISKVLLFTGGRKRIAIEDVLAVAGSSRVYNIFELQKAIGERQIARALKILHYMVRTERQDLLIVAMLARYFAVLWRLGELRSVTTNNAELGRALGISPFFVPEYLAALQRYSSDEIERALELLHHADVELKTSSLDTLSVLERTVLGIIEQQQNKAPLLPKGRIV